MNVQVEATYENGSFKLEQPLSLVNGQRVQLTVQVKSEKRKSYGLVSWTGSLQDLEFLINDAENDPLSMTLDNLPASTE